MRRGRPFCAVRPCSAIRACGKVVAVPPVQTSPTIGAPHRGAARAAARRSNACASCSNPSTQQRREDMFMSGLIWTIFAVIGMIVVIGWFLGRV